MKIKQIFSNMIYFLFIFLIFLIINQANAEDAGNSAKQEEFNKAIEMMRQQGYDEESLKQFEAIMQQGMKQEAQNEAVNLEREKNDFEQKWANNGNAQVELDGKKYELKVTRCYIDGLQDYKIEAEQPPGQDGGKFWAFADTQQVRTGYRSEFEFSTTENSYRPEVDPKLDFDGSKVGWEGKVASNNGSAAQIKFNLTLPCEKWR